MKTVAAFVLGFAAGMVCLAVVLWSTGSLQTAQAQAARTPSQITTASASSPRRPFPRRRSTGHPHGRPFRHADRRSGPADPAKQLLGNARRARA